MKVSSSKAKIKTRNAILLDNSIIISQKCFSGHYKESKDSIAKLTESNRVLSQNLVVKLNSYCCPMMYYYILLITYALLLVTTIVFRVFITKDWTLVVFYSVFFSLLGIGVIGSVYLYRRSIVHLNSTIDRFHECHSKEAKIKIRRHSFSNPRMLILCCLYSNTLIVEFFNPTDIYISIDQSNNDPNPQIQKPEIFSEKDKSKNTFNPGPLKDSLVVSTKTKSREKVIEKPKKNSKKLKNKNTTQNDFIPDKINRIQIS